MKIFEEIANRVKSENNIKHLTLNTKHLTLDTNTLILPTGVGEISDPSRLTPSSGIALLEQPSGSQQGFVDALAEDDVPALTNKDIQYIAVSLKTQTKEERIEVNVDFKLQNSTTFNKLIFNLVGWNRRREFFTNIQEIADWYGYQEAYKQQTKLDFIGKGRPRNKQQKGSRQRSPIREETAMLISAEKQLICHLWIEDAYFTLPFENWSDAKNIFCAKAEYVNNPGSKRIKRGGWL
jgi:hypothetical protein